MLAIPASFISWSEWQFPPWEWPWPCLCCLGLCPSSLAGAGSSCWGSAGASGVLLVGESGGWNSVSCVSLYPLSQETAVLSGSGEGRHVPVTATGTRSKDWTLLTFTERLQVQPLCIRATVQLVIWQLPANLSLLAGLLHALWAQIHILWSIASSGLWNYQRGSAWFTVPSRVMLVLPVGLCRP